MKQREIISAARNFVVAEHKLKFVYEIVQGKSPGVASQSILVLRFD